MQKKLLLVLVTIVWTGCMAFGQNYRLNDTLYVWEMHGVKIVADPAHPEQVQDKYYYGTPARVVDTDIHRFPASMEVNEGFYMPGHWVKVIMKQDTGYVFDGFLSRMRPFDLRSDTRGIRLVMHNWEGAAEVSKGIRSSAAPELAEGESREAGFDNGVHWNIKKVKPCIVEKYNLPESGFSATYQFMMAVYSNYFDQKATSMAEPEFVRMNGNRYEFILREDTGSQQISVFKKGKDWVVNTFSCED